MPSLMKRGVIPFPTGSQKGGARGWQVRSYYSESQVMEIRDILATYHIGRPRKDNLITNDITPTKQELTRRMGDGILTYTRTEDGRFIPIWGESINQRGMIMENEDTKVSVTLGYTLNLGNFQSLRVDLGIIDSRRDGENINDAFERVYKFVEDKLAEKVNEAEAEINEK